MKSTFIFTGFVVLFIAGLLLVGCGDDESNITSNSGPDGVAIASVYPADGAVDVPTSAPIAVKFSGPVDTLSVMQNLHLAGGQPMHEWRDSLNDQGGFGMMSMNMESHMMTWMDSIHTPGEFHWNESLDSCEFVPDSTLMGATEYLCVLYEGGMQGRHGGMMGGEGHNDDGYHMYGFETGP